MQLKVYLILIQKHKKIIEEWKASTDNKSLKKICRLQKNDNSYDSNILSITEKGIFQLDPRKSGDVKTSEQRDYSTN